jgi:hypothetical protein
VEGVKVPWHAWKAPRQCQDTPKNVMDKRLPLIVTETPSHLHPPQPPQPQHA